MARSLLILFALASVSAAFVAPVEPVNSQHVPASAAPRRMLSQMDSIEPETDAGVCGQAVVMSVLAGLIVGLAAPASSFAEETTPPPSSKASGGFRVRCEG